MKNRILFLFCIIVALFPGYAPAQQQAPLDNELIIGYYGRPGAASLGVLGQSSIEELIPKIKEKAAEYNQIAGDKKVRPAFHLIHGLASSEPGRKKDYIISLSDEKVMEYINAAQENGFAVFIDLQLGGLTPLEAVTPVLKFLKYKDVHIAIDPEFEVRNLDVQPGKVVGHISSEEINQVQAAMADYLDENGIKEHKILIVHMFRKSMVVKGDDAVKKYDNIYLIMNLDGHGSPRLKVDIYNSLYTADHAPKISGGFKLFFNEDKPSLLSPGQVLGMDAVGSTKIKNPPKYINYQ